MPKDFEAAVAEWQSLVSDNDTAYDRVITIDVSQLAPMVTWGTNYFYGNERETAFPVGYE